MVPLTVTEHTLKVEIIVGVYSIWVQTRKSNRKHMKWNIYILKKRYDAQITKSNIKDEGVLIWLYYLSLKKINILKYRRLVA